MLTPFPSRGIERNAAHRRRSLGSSWPAAPKAWGGTHEVAEAEGPLVTRGNVNRVPTTRTCSKGRSAGCTRDDSSGHRPCPGGLNSIGTCVLAVLATSCGIH